MLSASWNKGGSSLVLSLQLRKQTVKKGAGMNNNVQKEIVAMFDADTRRTHRFTIVESEGIKGSIYLPKDKVVPGTLLIHLQTKAEAERKGKDDRK
jgi:hypothetical protein